MSPLAQLAKKFGHRVSGSDIAESIQVSNLRKMGVPVCLGANLEWVKKADALVYSSAIDKSSDLEFCEGLRLNKKIIHRAELLANYFNDAKFGIGIAGTHGKTTSTAMVSHFLSYQGLPVHAVCGGVQKNLIKQTEKYGPNDYLVCEIDESDGSIRHFKPSHAIITNIDADHLETHKSIHAIEVIFAQFVAQIKEEGALAFGWDSQRQKVFFENLRRDDLRVLTFGTDLGCDVRAFNIRGDLEGTHFQAVVERDVFEVFLPLVGVFNVRNALGSMAIARLLDLDLKGCIAALAEFKGVEKRQNILFNNKAENQARGKIEKEKNDLPHLLLVDDYAHNPGKIQAVLSGFRSAHPNARLIAVFEPHRQSRVTHMFDELCQSFQLADQVLILPIYGAFEKKDGLSLRDRGGPDPDVAMMREGIRNASGLGEGCVSVASDRVKEIFNLMSFSLDQTNIILFLGAGHSSSLAKDLTAHLPHFLSESRS